MPEMTEVTDLVGRRARKKQQTRDALVAAAMDLFVVKGFAETTIEDITEAADVSARTFFRYFDSKEAVLFDGHVAMVDALGTALELRPMGEDVLVGIREALHALALMQAEATDHVLTRAQISLDAPEVQNRAAMATREWEETIATWLRSRLPEDVSGMLADVMAAACVASLRVGLAHWVASGGRGDPVDAVDEAMGLLSTFG